MHTRPWFSCAAALLFAISAAGARAEIVDIGSEELKALIQQGTPLVDLRSAAEWRQMGVIKGSQLITLIDEQGHADPAAWSRQIDKIAATGKPLVLICRSGNRSAAAAQYLDKAGRKGTVYNVKAGIAGWMRDGQALVSVEQNLRQAGVRCLPSC